MSLNGIDIASYQSSLDPAAMRDTDFIIIKATQGTGYANPTWRRQADQTLHAGKLLGLYHYISGGDAAAEARYFADAARPYLGKAVLALDWESGQNRAWGDMGYLRAVASEVIRLTGVRPLLYGSRAVYGQLSAVGHTLDCGLWVAQYASMAATGYQQHPWNEGEYQCAIRQYSSAGRIAGYAGCLDLDLAYMDRAAWMRYAAVNGKPVPVTPAKPVLNLDKMADDVIAGKYGDGNTRRSALGANYAAVQAIVNRKLGNASRPTGGRVYVVRSGDTLSGIAARYGTTWQRLQQLNGIADANLIRVGQAIRIDSAAPASPRVYTVKAGDTLGAIAARLGTTWQHLQALNGIPNANRIWPGQRIRY